jgi:hypothetical protein
MAIAIAKLTIVGKKALFALRRRCNDLSITEQQAEQVHIMFLRGILGVNKTTSIFVVLGEFGRYPLEYFWWQQTLKYYDRLRKSTADRLLYCAYQTQIQMLSMLNDNQQCWLRKV